MTAAAIISGLARLLSSATPAALVYLHCIGTALPVWLNVFPAEGATSSTFTNPYTTVIFTAPVAVRPVPSVIV